MLLEYDAVVFDCDGTLSSIEGITELARMNNCFERINDLTEQAMCNGGLNHDLFKQRLDLITPSQTNVASLSDLYFANRTNNITILIEQLLQQGKEIYIVSAGYLPAIIDFARMLNIDASNVFAVDLTFSEDGSYLDFDRNSPLIENNGKAQIIKQLSNNKKVIYIGDGANDLAVKPYVQKFIGFGAHFYREPIKQQSDAYIETNDAMLILNYINSD